MSFANWKKRQKVMGKYLPEGYHAMASLIAEAAYKAGERAGREHVVALMPNIEQWRSIEQWRKENIE